MEEVLAVFMVFSIPVLIILTRFYLKLQELKLNSGVGDGSGMRKELGSLMADNEELRERVKNLEYIINDEKRRIELDYEKEQILIDKKKYEGCAYLSLIAKLIEAKIGPIFFRRSISSIL